MDIPSRLDFYGIGRRYVISRARNIDPAVIDVQGSDANVFVGATSFMAQQVSRQLADGLRNLTLDAEGDQLDRVVMDRYQLPRKGAAPAVGSVDLARAVATAGAGTVDLGTKMTTRGGVEYVSLTAGSFDASTTSGVSVDVRAVQAGAAFQVGANQVVAMSNPGILFDPTIQPNNPLPMSGGADRETDPDYRNRARNFWSAARRGTVGAIAFGALAVPGVDSAFAMEELDPTGRPARIVTLVAADGAGQCNRVLAARIEQGLLDYRAAGITVIVLGSQPQIITVRLALTFRAGVDTSTLSNDIRAAVVEFVNSLGANQALRRADLSAVLARYRDAGLVPVDGTIAEPVGDLIPDFGKTLRCRLSDVVLV